MHKDERDLLDVLKFELQFLEKGGYGRSPREPWRPQFIFEDSPTCMNYDCKDCKDPCTECVLIHLVPPDQRGQEIPCRHIRLNETGETLDSLYRYADDRDIADTVRAYLRNTIERIEAERANPPSPIEQEPAEPLVGGGLQQNLHPKCANPACADAFHWLAGGKFFRFRPSEAELSSEHPTAAPELGGRHVRHYWLCERCASRFTLVYIPDTGVVLKALWNELPVAESQEALPAA